VRVGIFQCAAGGLDQPQRLARLGDQLMGRNLDLVVCPELFMSGYNAGETMPQLAEPCEGSFSRQVADLAITHGTSVIYGYPELADGLIYNAAVCIDVGGNILVNQRKMLLPPGFESEVFTKGTNQVLFDLNGIRCAILICYDAEFPENFRAAAMAGAQMIIVPTALLDKWQSVSLQMMPTRAFENGVWVIYANHAGEEGGMSFLGSSCVVSPDGTDAARAGSAEELLEAEIDLGQIKMARSRLPYLDDVKKLQRLS
jgi:5-aminopentanamidase